MEICQPQNATFENRLISNCQPQNVTFENRLISNCQPHNYRIMEICQPSGAQFLAISQEMSIRKVPCFFDTYGSCGHDHHYDTAASSLIDFDNSTTVLTRGSTSKRSKLSGGVTHDTHQRALMFDDNGGQMIANVHPCTGSDNLDVTDVLYSVLSPAFSPDSFLHRVAHPWINNMLDPLVVEWREDLVETTEVDMTSGLGYVAAILSRILNPANRTDGLKELTNEACGLATTYAMSAHLKKETLEGWMYPHLDACLSACVEVGLVEHEALDHITAGEIADWKDILGITPTTRSVSSNYPCTTQMITFDTDVDNFVRADYHHQVRDRAVNTNFDFCRESLKRYGLTLASFLSPHVAGKFPDRVRLNITGESMFSFKMSYFLSGLINQSHFTNNEWTTSTLHTDIMSSPLSLGVDNPMTPFDAQLVAEYSTTGGFTSADGNFRKFAPIDLMTSADGPDITGGLLAHLDIDKLICADVYPTGFNDLFTLPGITEALTDFAEDGGDSRLFFGSVEATFNAALAANTVERQVIVTATGLPHDLGAMIAEYASPHCVEFLPPQYHLDYMGDRLFKACVLMCWAVSQTVCTLADTTACLIRHRFRSHSSSSIALVSQAEKKAAISIIVPPPRFDAPAPLLRVTRGLMLASVFGLTPIHEAVFNVSNTAARYVNADGDMDAFCASEAVFPMTVYNYPQKMIYDPASATVSILGGRINVDGHEYNATTRNYE